MLDLFNEVRTKGWLTWETVFLGRFRNIRRTEYMIEGTLRDSQERDSAKAQLGSQKIDYPGMVLGVGWSRGGFCLMHCTSWRL